MVRCTVLGRRAGSIPGELACGPMSSAETQRCRRIGGARRGVPAAVPGTAWSEPDCVGPSPGKKTVSTCTQTCYTARRQPRWRMRYVCVVGWEIVMDPIVQQPFAVSVGTSNLEEARATCGEHLYPRSMRLIDPSARLAARFAFLHLGGLTVGDVRYGAAVAGECAELGRYHVNLVLAGRFAARQGARTINGDTGTAGVYRPVGHNFLQGASADCHLLGLSVDTGVLEEALASLLNAPVRGRLRLAEQLDVRQAPGRTCAELIRLLADEIHNPTGLIYQPIAAAPLQESLLMSLLLAIGHQHHDVLRQRTPRCAN